MHRFTGSVSRWLWTCATALAVSTGALAQGVTGSALSGTVTDPSGAPVPDATVQLKNNATGALFNATTAANGKFVIDNVPPGGPFTLTVQGGMFEPVTRDVSQLSLGQRISADIQLKTVMGEAIEIISHLDSLEDKRRTGPTTQVKETVINTLPLSGRNFTGLLATDPRTSGTSIGGQNNRFNNIQIDGGANNDLFGLAGSGTPGGQSGAKPLSLEAVKEFVIQMAPFDVRQGSFAGGLVNLITKSGTNEFHGSVFGYYQGKALSNQKAYTSLNGVFDNYDDPTYLSFNTWQFGGSVGGPILKDKVHFFISADLQAKTQSFGNAFQIGGVDSAADIARAGFDKTIADRFVSILNKYGIANPGTALGTDLGNPDRNLFAKITVSNEIPNSQLEISYNLVSANQDILGRSATSPSFSASGSSLRDGYQLSNAGYGQHNTTNTGRIKLTTNFDGGRLSNEFLAGVSIIRDSRDIAQNVPLILVKVGKVGASDSWLAAGGERFSQANILDQNIYQLQDNLTWTKDTHRLTIGTSNEFFNFRNVFLQAATGVWAFNSLDDLDAGIPTEYLKRFGVSPLQDPGTASFSVAQLGLYVQDEWSILPNLTLTPGFRVDLPLLSAANANQSLLAANNPAFPIDTSNVPSANPLWAPRLGFNWDVDGSSDTIVRGGVGLFSGRPPYVWVSNAYSINGLSQVQLTCYNNGAKLTNLPFTADPTKQPTDCSGGSGTPTAPVNNGEIDYFDPATRYPQNLRVALGADRRLPFGIVVSGDFLWTRDVNGWYTTDENLVRQDPPTSAQGEASRILYGSFAGSTATSLRVTPTRYDSTHLSQAVRVENIGGGHVTSFTLQAQKQLLENYGVVIGYTYSRSLDRMSFTSSQALSNFQFAPLDGPIDNRALRPSAFDQPHKVTITATAEYPTPYGAFGGALTYVGISGTAYTWTVNGDVNGDGVSGNDLVFVPKDPSQISLSGTAAQQQQQWNDLDAFIKGQSCLNDARGGFIQRGACRNPWQDFLDLRLSWTSPKIKGEQRIEIQWDIFNVLNLLNPRWGHFDQVVGFENINLLRATGFDAANSRPVYTFVAPASVTNTVYSPTASRWRMQLGARYVF